MQVRYVPFPHRRQMLPLRRNRRRRTFPGFLPLQEPFRRWTCFLLVFFRESFWYLPLPEFSFSQNTRLSVNANIGQNRPSGIFSARIKAQSRLQKSKGHGKIRLKSSTHHCAGISVHPGWNINSYFPGSHPVHGFYQSLYFPITGRASPTPKQRLL